MTRNISQWMSSPTAPSSPCHSDELCLLRNGQPQQQQQQPQPQRPLVHHHPKRRQVPAHSSPLSEQSRRPRCVSWAPGIFESASSLLPGSRDHRRKATRSWYGGQSCSGVSPADIGPKVGPYGSFTTTTVAADPGGLLCSPTQSQPLLSPHRPATIQIQKQHLQGKQQTTQRPPPTSTPPPPNITVTPASASPTASPLPVKKKTTRSRGIELIMPSLRSLVSRRGASGSTTSLTGLSSDGLRTPTIVVEGPNGVLRKCETAVTLSAASSRATLLTEPLQATNRLRVGNRPSDTLCSRCSSLLSLATSGSRYSLNAAAGTFVPVPPVLCKLCLSEVPHSDTCTLQQCSCSFCKDCMQAYVSFEIVEGAYDISCPDAQCPTQGVISLAEIERLVDSNLVNKHKKYRLNREVDIDKCRTWCPRAGCETVCQLCPTERCSPQSVHCPTCSSDFCSNCKQAWHGTTSCEDQARLAGDEQTLGIPFDSDLIKCCPMCNVPIEKDEGCAQMMCKRCKHVFCWYCLASLDDDFLLRHYDKGPCKNKLGHSRASVIWHRTQVIGIFAGFGILLLVASPLLLLAAPCIVCCKCRVCNSNTKLDNEEEIPEESAS